MDKFSTGLAAGIVLMAVLVAAWATGYDQGARECQTEQGGPR